ncbi:prolipoprotein diacylglyceryl transferase [Tengunoibacter tsumagoiensis]|uniref:Phosphatidylglycerol--prolipoprotein diacylglyceryl transferase n=1 Tax=Tengunoibacter tsumagoiensis TaxID=2014871 RepID=A0A401ZZI1_9CHLR|nr:prolipoprotein diacylglyceryl transferase [Tengunoibacter tsumagoiensis]GCE12221.1 prolipoprotein diacylglyceryl transferase [Tengunoibacter tsumagoiensis]
MYPPISPVLPIGPLSLHWYGVIMALAIMLATWVAGRFVSRHGGDSSIIWDMLLWVLIPAIIGARLYYVFIQSPRGPSGLPHYLSNPVEILEVWKGGIHIYGAIIFGGITALIYLRYKKLSYPLYLDGIGLGLALGQTIGRLGNFVNQELYGPPTSLPWGLHIDQDHRIAPYDNMQQYPDTVLFQPLFLYEMLWDGLGFLLLLWLSRRFSKRLFTGDIFLLYLIWVPTGRFFLEFLRTDSWFFPGTPFNVVHIIIALLVITALVVLIRRHRGNSTGPTLQEQIDGVSSSTISPTATAPTTKAPTEESEPGTEETQADSETAIDHSTTD